MYEIQQNLEGLGIDSISTSYSETQQRSGCLRDDRGTTSESFYLMQFYLKMTILQMDCKQTGKLCCPLFLLRQPYIPT